MYLRLGLDIQADGQMKRLLLGVIVVGNLAGGLDTTKQRVDAAASGSGSPTAPVASPTPKQLTDKDYYEPLDSWLKKQQSPLSGEDFYQVGKAYHIDPDLLIAIAKAETNLGRVRQRGSTFNIGSVCSYDSSNSTCVATSYRQGVEQIAQTLTNQYLGGYANVGQLSRKHNPTGHVYASSTEHWENNVLNTLSALKGKTIDATYNFRR